MEQPSPAECAQRALAALAAHKALVSSPSVLNESGLSDLLTDLAHLAAEHGWSFERECECAAQNCADERRNAGLETAEGV